MTEQEIESKVDKICEPLFELIKPKNGRPDTTCQIVYNMIGQITKTIVNKYRRIGKLEKE